MDEMFFLIVDDDSLMRRYVIRLLTRIYPNAVFAEAENAVKTQEILQDFKPSVIIMDFNMPGLNGIRTTARVRRDPRMNDVKILIISAEPIDNLDQKALHAGADAFLSKPLEPEKFIEAVTRLVKESSD
jgi:CheY-like chemotaxis protein